MVLGRKRGMLDVIGRTDLSWVRYWWTACR